MKKLAIILGAVAMMAASPVSAAQGPRGDEPVAVPRTIKQGIDFVYVDPQMSSVARRKQRPQNWLARLFDFGSSNRRGAPNMMFDGLARGLQQYQATWGRLPQTKIPAGAALKRGSTGKRVSLLRTRLGLSPSGGYDEQLFQAVSAYQAVHGLGTPDGIAGRATIASLNRGAIHYARRIAINMERAYRLPATRAFDRYVVVDSGAAEAYLFDRDRMVDKMRVIVGSPKTKTPMMAVLMRNAKANPYWHVPPELVRSLTAKKVEGAGPLLFQGLPLRGAVQLVRQRPPCRSEGRQLAGDRLGQAKADNHGPTASGTMEFDGRNEVRDAQRLWHLPPRHAHQGEVRRRSLDQQRLRAP